jgi:hypothetical protein
LVPPPNGKDLCGTGLVPTMLVLEWKKKMEL